MNWDDDDIEVPQVSDGLRRVLLITALFYGLLAGGAFYACRTEQAAEREVPLAPRAETTCEPRGCHSAAEIEHWYDGGLANLSQDELER